MDARQSRTSVGLRAPVPRESYGWECQLLEDGELRYGWRLPLHGGALAESEAQRERLLGEGGVPRGGSVRRDSLMSQPSLAEWPRVYASSGAEINRHRYGFVSRLGPAGRSRRVRWRYSKSPHFEHEYQSHRSPRGLTPPKNVRTCVNHASQTGQRRAGAGECGGPASATRSHCRMSASRVSVARRSDVVRPRVFFIAAFGPGLFTAAIALAPFVDVRRPPSEPPTSTSNIAISA